VRNASLPMSVRVPLERSMVGWGSSTGLHARRFLTPTRADRTTSLMHRPLERFPRQTTDKVRYADTDRQGHVNNALFAAFLETGRVEILYDPNQPLAADGAEFVIARLSLDFRREIQWPGSVAVGTGVREIGRSSVTFEQAIYQDGRCVADAEAVIVQIDGQSRKPRPLTDATKAKLETLRIRDPRRL
jgi:acyl-CoA thioester hydrolase